MNAKEYIAHLLSIEEYSFSLEEIAKNTDGVGTSLKFELHRLAEKKEILNLRKGFYLIIPPRYSSAQKLPVQLYAEKLFKYLKRNYYIGLYTAAKFHGASHQQSQRDYFITETPKLNSIKKKSLDLQFFTTSTWPPANVTEKKSDAGIYRISSPALTMVDLINYHPKLGGLNRMLASLEELSEELYEEDATELLKWYNTKSTLQRAGFLLEELNGNNPISEIIYEQLNRNPFFPVLLSPKKGQKPGSVNNKWKIDINLKLESDL